MAPIDPRRERQRLAEVYASQTDGELEQSAVQADQLTDVAREALRTEMANRGMKTLMELPFDERGEPEFRDLVTVRTFWSLPEANLAKGILENAGIEVFLFDENIVGLGWYANAVSGVKLKVDRENAEEADRVLREAVSGSDDPESADSSF